MNKSLKYNLSFIGFLWIGVLLLILGALSSKWPDFGIVFSILAIIAILVHNYLKSPISNDDSFASVYPKRLAVISILLYIFMPHLFYKLGDIGLVIEFTVPLLILIVGNYYALKYRDFKWRSARANIWILAIIGSILLSMIYGYATKGVPFNVRDILIIKEPVFYFLTFNLFYQMDWRADEVKRYFIAPIIYGGLATIIIGYVQYFNFAGINEPVFSFWTEKHHLIELMKPDARRVFSTYYSAGSFGIFLICLCSYLMAKLFSENAIRRIPTIIIFMLAVVAVFMTGSKGAFIVFVMLILIFPAVFFVKTSKKIIGTVVSVTALVVISIISMPFIGETFMMQRLKSVQDSVMNIARYGANVRMEEVLDETSVGRMAPVMYMMPKLIESPILGFGPSKSILHEQSYYLSEEEKFKNPFESSYLSLVFRFGVVGLFFGLAIIAHIVLLMIRVLQTKNIPVEYHQIASANLAFCLLSLVIFLNTDAIYNMRLMFSIYAASGIIASYLISIKPQGKTSNI
ncbi:O-antigen ligase family protein [bacterium]|nr:O-antigen ligase family protein [bacterium]